MGWKLFSGRPSEKTVRKLVRALYQGAKNVNPTAEDYRRWNDAVRKGMSLAEVTQSVVEEVYRQRLEGERERLAAERHAWEAERERFGNELQAAVQNESAPPPEPQPPPAGAPLFVPPGHFYSPVVDPAEGAEAYERVARAPWPVSLPGIPLDRETMLATWRELVPLFETSGLTAKPPPNFRYGFENNHYGRVDGLMLSAMIRKFRPSQIIEIGSGWSSACTLDTLQRNLDIRCEVTFIEPYPQLLQDRLGADYAKYRVFAEPVQKVDPDLFATLGAGDILFIDSTHVVKTGSDVCFELFEILPRLKSGVLVHVHDMFWPFEYPKKWILEENRSWNEIYAYRALLTDSPDWEIVMFNNYMFTVELEVVKATWPAYQTNSSALWLRKR